jgi:RHS repeat-associated protein
MNSSISNSPFLVQIKKNKPLLSGVLLLLVAAFVALVVVATTILVNRSNDPEIKIDANLQGRTKYAYTTNEVDYIKGGVIESASKKIKLILPDNYYTENLTISLREVSSDNLKANAAVGPMFEITALNSKGEEVTKFSKNLQIETNLNSEELAAVSDKQTATYFYNEGTNQWEKLATSLNDNKIIASTNHFTVFTSSSGDPNAGTSGLQNSSTGAIIDDSDPSPVFIWKNLGDPDQPAYRDTISTGYKSGATITGNSINNTPHNSGTWTANGLSGSLDVSVTIPTVSYCTNGGSCADLTTRATYKIYYSGGVDTVDVNQFAEQGGTVKLGTYEFDGTGKVELTDVVAEQGDFFTSFIVFDAVIFGDVSVDLDITPPLIEDVKAMTYDGKFTIQAKVTDVGSGVDQVVLFLTRGNGTVETHVMTLGDNDIYSVTVSGIKQGENLDYSIGAIDLAGNESSWDRKRGYLTRSMNGRYLGYHPGMIARRKNTGYEVLRCNPACGGVGQNGGDPINTLNGNMLDQFRLLDIKGRPEIDLYLTYNGQGGRLGIFGESWTHSYSYHLIEMDNPGFEGAYVQYPDGFIAQFNGSDFSPEEGVHEKLTKTGSGYELLFKDLSKVVFDADGDITRWEDTNGNGLTFEYGTKVKYTMLSEIKSIKADGGREIKFEYTDGLVTKITAPESIQISLNYNEDDLVEVKDGRSNATKFEYTDHNLTKKVSPDGHTYYSNEYDGDRRVTKQIGGDGYLSVFAYGDEETTMTDANNNSIVYKYEDNLLEEIVDQKGLSLKYEFDDDKNVVEYEDKDGNKYEYEYDENGNQTYEKDPLGNEIKREFNQTFNKPTKVTYKQNDHVTKYEYDSKGNLTKVTDAKGNSKKLTYNALGQLVEETDFRGNLTKYAYTSEGDLKKVTNALNDSENFEYDGVGRVAKYKTFLGHEYVYSYDQNNNLVKLNGPLGYELSYKYDSNNHLVEETDANGGNTKYKYDNSENLVEQQNQLGFVTSKKYGPMNDQNEEVDAEGRVSKFSYDQSFNIIGFTEAKGTDDEATTTFEYNGMRMPTKLTDAEGRVKKFEYDPLQRLTKEVENVTSNAANSENNVKTEYEYTSTGKISKIVDANGNSTVFTYDVLDQLIEVKDAENQVTKYAYDEQGNIVSVKNPRGFETKYAYDKLNRLEKTTDAKGGNTKYAYDADSNLVLVTDANSVTTKYAYDALDRLVSKVENFVLGGLSNEDTNVLTKYEYDLNGNLTKSINPRGFETSFAYDAANRLVKVTDSYGKVTSYEYNKVDNLLEIKDRNGNSKNYAYDNLNRVVISENEEDHKEKFKYDKVGNEIKYTNERGKVYVSVYDPLNRVKEVTNPLQNKVSTKYDAVGNVLEFTDQNGHTDKFAYDKVYRLVKQTDAENFATTFNYDANGNTVKVTDANGNPTNFSFDELDRLINVVNAENEKTEFGYDALTNRTLAIEADGTKHAYKYDPLYRLVEVVNNQRLNTPNSADTNVVTRYSYDPNGNLVAQKNPLGNITRFEYDKLDRLAKETNPLDKVWAYGYDNEENITSRKDANGDVTGYSYYPDYELKKINYPTYSVNYLYSETNYPTQMVDNLGTTTWAYDDIDRMVSQNDPFNKKLNYAYDPVGNLTKLTYPDNRFVSHSYLKNDWLKTSVSSDSDKVDYARDKVGNTVKVNRSNTTEALIAYDKVYRTLEVNDYQTTKGKHLINKFNYTYNDVGHITTEVAEYGWRQPAVVTTQFKYDGLHRLNDATDTDSNSTAYEYDAAGNRVKLNEKLKQGTEVRSYNYNAANQLEKINIVSPHEPNNIAYDFKYDANGNRIDELIKDETGVERGVRYDYDFENRLLVAQEYQGEIVKKQPEPEVNVPDSYPDSLVESYVEPEAVESQPVEEYKVNDLSKTILEYDGNGRRLVSTYYPGSSEKGQRREYAFDRLDPVVEYDLQNGQRNNIYRDARQNLMFYQEFKSEQAPNGTIYFYHYDGEGNISATSKHDGQSDHTYRYDEYGAVMPEVGGDKNQNNGAGWLAPHNEYALSQKQYDSNMDLYYFGARHYDAKTGTWMTQDSYRGETQNPMSLHRYMYNYSSPVNYIDWYGYFGDDYISPTDPLGIDRIMYLNHVGETASSSAEVEERLLREQTADSTLTLGVIGGGFMSYGAITAGAYLAPGVLSGITAVSTAYTTAVTASGDACMSKLGVGLCEFAVDLGENLYTDFLADKLDVDMGAYAGPDAMPWQRSDIDIAKIKGAWNLAFPSQLEVGGGYDVQFPGLFDLLSKVICYKGNEVYVNGSLVFEEQPVAGSSATINYNRTIPIVGNTQPKVDPNLLKNLNLKPYTNNYLQPVAGSSAQIRR